MVDFKVVIGTKSGKCYQREVKEAEGLIGKKIGESINGELIGLQGWEFQISGGSDNCGFPMRWDIEGVNRKRILTTKTMGCKKLKFKGQKKRKTFCGNTIHKGITQINLKVVKEGSEPLDKPAEEPKQE